MTPFAYGLLSVPLFLPVGFVVLRAILPMETRLTWVETVPLSFLCGTGVLSVLIFWQSLAWPGTLSRLTIFALASGLLVVGGAVWLARWRRSPTSPDVGQSRRLRTPARSLDPWAVLLGLIPVVQVLGVFRGAVETGLGWDGAYVWASKAMMVYVNGGIPASSISGPGRFYLSHPDHPWLLPLSEAWLFFAQGSADVDGLRLLTTGFFGCLLLLFYAALRRSYSVRYSLFGTIGLGALPALFFQAQTNYADVPLSAFHLGSMTYLYYWFREQRSEDLRLAALLASLAGWVKQEGALYLLLAVAAVIIAGLSGHRRRRLAAQALLTYAIPAIVVLGPWYYQLATHQMIRQDLSLPNGGVAGIVFERLPAVLSTAFVYLNDFREWGILWWLFLAALLALRRNTQLSLVFLGSTASVSLLFLTLVFVFSRWPDHIEHMEATYYRLLVHPAPVALFFVLTRFDWLEQAIGPAASMGVDERG